VTGKPEAISRTLSPAGNAVVIVGLGSDQNTETWREIGGAIGRGLSGEQSLELDLGVPDQPSAVALMEGVALGSYAYSAAKTQPKLKRVALVTSLSLGKADFERTAVIAEAVHLARDLAATPANELYPAKFAERAVAAAEKAGIKVEVLDEKELKRQGFG